MGCIYFKIEIRERNAKRGKSFDKVSFWRLWRHKTSSWHSDRWHLCQSTHNFDSSYSSGNSSRNFPRIFLEFSLNFPVKTVGTINCASSTSVMILNHCTSPLQTKKVTKETVRLARGTHSVICWLARWMIPSKFGTLENWRKNRSLSRSQMVCFFSSRCVFIRDKLKYTFTLVLFLCGFADKKYVHKCSLIQRIFYYKKGMTSKKILKDDFWSNVFDSWGIWEGCIFGLPDIIDRQGMCWLMAF